MFEKYYVKVFHGIESKIFLECFIPCCTHYCHRLGLSLHTGLEFVTMTNTTNFPLLDKIQKHKVLLLYLMVQFQGSPHELQIFKKHKSKYLGVPKAKGKCNCYYFEHE